MILLNWSRENWAFNKPEFGFNIGVNIQLYHSSRSHQQCSMKKGVLENFAKFTGKNLSQSLFFNKVAGLRSAILLKKGDTGTGVFLGILWNFQEHLFYRTRLRLLLYLRLRSFHIGRSKYFLHFDVIKIFKTIMESYEK